MAPGMGHCRGGPGPDTFDALSALEAWVEEDRAPERIVASKLEGGEVVRTRPLCPYPASGTVERHRQHRRRRELQLRHARLIRPPNPPVAGLSRHGLPAVHRGMSYPRIRGR